jgi:hypothetical protein
MTLLSEAGLLGDEVKPFLTKREAVVLARHIRDGR